MTSRRSILLALLLLATSPVAWSQVLLDQSQYERATNLAVGSSANQRVAQIFRAGLDGELAMVKLSLGCGDPADTVTISLQTLDGAGKPSGSMLDSVSLSGSVLPPSPVFDEGLLHAIPLTGARVEAGQLYALVIEANPGAGCALFVSGNDNPYADGELYFEALPNPSGWILDPGAPDRDFVFETYVDRGDSGSDPRAGLCEFRNADGTPNNWVPASVPVCACLRDRSLTHNRCWFRLPGFVLIRELPLWPKGDFVARWSVLPLADGTLPVEVELHSRSGKLVGDPLVIEVGKPLYAAPVPEVYWADGPGALEATRVIVRSGKQTFEFDTRRGDLPKP